MVKLNKLAEYLDHYLAIDEIEDDCWNGLQIEGSPDVNKVVFAVDASIDAFKKAADSGANLIIVHHGHFWKSYNPSLVQWSKKRIDELIEMKISLYACHLPLDRHKKVGNNAQLLKLLGASIKSEFRQVDGKNIGWIGEARQPLSIQEVNNILSRQLKANCIVLPFGKKVIKTIAVCSGSGGYDGFYEAMLRRVDLYITGDTIEIYSTAKDAEMNIVFAGHYATETIGLKALSEIVRRVFRVEIIFIDR
jgi:dinuclear metal center YbgI/SA1388 family protein